MYDLQSREIFQQRKAEESDKLRQQQEELNQAKLDRQEALTKVAETERQV